MKLVVFGLTVSSSWGNGHATLWRGLLTALAKRGHRVTFFERDVPYYAFHRDCTELPGHRLILYREWSEVLPLARAELAEADAGIEHDQLEGVLVAACGPETIPVADERAIGGEVAPECPAVVEPHGDDPAGVRDVARPLLAVGHAAAEVDRLGHIASRCGSRGAPRSATASVRTRTRRRRAGCRPAHRPSSP